MDVNEAIGWIHGRLPFGIKPGLKRMEWFMEQLDHPENKLRAIHIAGTNGKGSTLSYIRNLLQYHGFRVGTFTSPYIMKFHERISLNGIPISDEDLVHHVKKIKPLYEKLEQTPLGAATEFEVITAIAFDYFAQQEVDYVIFETGLGGRLDSTNIVRPLITVITNVGKDHMNILGDTYEEIAFEKAGIIKNRIPLVTAVNQRDARKVVCSQARKMHAPVYEYGKDFFSSNHQLDEGKEHFTFQSSAVQLDDITLNMKGTHQTVNASLALQTFLLLTEMEKLEFDPLLVKKALLHTTWPGRFEIIQDNPVIILDGAHNEEGIKTLVDTLNRYYPDHRRQLIFTVLHDKPVTGMLSLLENHVDQFRFTTFDFPRAISPKELYKKSRASHKSWHQSWKEAIEKCVQTASDKDVIVITGSLYFISEVRNYFDRIKRLC
ncbi:dihydrofolate synthase/folylpolyglutamate synthase [Melghiribacillus thermohalophilus]|uniref:Dihydrofolate synthase/folylpolyglutamate synthase n=1 Tax=Melghiribacillus thermohalophilus TaxID=1324956 RepID=A0A4R3NBX5_9BACI|nr:folylpolyglutamate synthase/dihydrofolate synthase family protein [Melghiribacillus thermohalophilus]TCT27137.1 dihydrofolate synthase/folylpolyglutamate synthase [Melghiribacillus thermohalophilus]